MVFTLRLLSQTSGTPNNMYNRCSDRQNLASHTACRSSPSSVVKPYLIQPVRRVGSQHCNSVPIPLSLVSFCHQHAQSAARQQRCTQQRVQAAPLEVLADLKTLPDWDVKCAAGVAVFAYVWVKVFDGLASRGVLSQVSAMQGPVEAQQNVSRNSYSLRSVCARRS